jgi:hypothetical protein
MCGRFSLHANPEVIALVCKLGFMIENDTITCTGACVV